MSNSFWAWTIVTVAIAAVAALTRDRYAAPWAAGAACATLLEGLGVDPRWGWAAFLITSSALFVIFNVRRGKHSRRRNGSPGDRDDEHPEPSDTRGSAAGGD